MEVTKNSIRFDQAASRLCERIEKKLMNIPLSAKENASEIRVRAGMPLALTCPGQIWFIDEDSRLSNIPKNAFKAAKEDIEESVIKMCSYSMHTHQEEIKNGFIPLLGGHRAGLAGTAVSENGRIISLRDINSINLRIARDVKGAGDKIIKEAFEDGLCGLLIFGTPGSGKTTVLRDIARQLSGGFNGRYIKVAVVDERGEIAAAHEGEFQNDMGICCDVLSGFPKGAGIETAVRTLSPGVIICDEIGGEEEVDSMINALNSGVVVIASAHAGNLSQLYKRPQIKRLIDLGVFDKIAELGSAEEPGRLADIVKAGELTVENNGTRNDNSLLFDVGALTSIKTKK